VHDRGSWQRSRICGYAGAQTRKTRDTCAVGADVDGHTRLALERIDVGLALYEYIRYVYVYIHIGPYSPTLRNISIFLECYSHMYMYIYVCIYIYMYIYICT